MVFVVTDALDVVPHDFNHVWVQESLCAEKRNQVDWLREPSMVATSNPEFHP